MKMLAIFVGMMAAIAGAKEVRVPGGMGISHSLSESEQVEPNTLCVMTCEAKRLGSGTVLCGSNNVSCDDVSSWSGWKRKQVVFRVPARINAHRFRVGTFNNPSGAVFRAMSFGRASVEYSKQGDLCLGHGEVIDGNEYFYETQFGSDGHIDSRALVRWSGAFFNTDRVCMSKNAELLFRHTLGKRSFLTGEITVSAIHTGGAVSAEVSTDGKDFLKVATLTNANNVAVALPEQMLPAREVFVRLRGVEGGGLQIKSYSFTSRIDGEAVSFAGASRYYDDKGKLVGRCNAPVLHAAGYGELLPQVEGLKLWQASSGWKVSRSRALPTVKAKALTLRAAANEAESVQLVVKSEVELKDVRIDCEDLVMAGSTSLKDAKIPSSSIEVRRVGYVVVRQASDVYGCRGAWPDPLLAQDASSLAVKAGENQPFWITVTVPKGAKKGLYKGALRISAVKGDDSRVSGVIPFSLEVFGFELPDVVTLKSAFGLNPVEVSKWHHARSREQKRETFNRYKSLFSAYRISMGRPAAYDDWVPKWDKSAGEDNPEKWEPVFNWASWDKTMEEAFTRYHFNAFNVRPWKFWGGFGDGFYKPELAGLKPEHRAYPVLLRKYLKGIGDHLREKGWSDKAYVYWYDEPTVKSYANVIEGMKILKETMPDVKRLLTEQPESALLGYTDIWCPMPHYMHTEHEAACREAGEEFWWYLCTEPKAPYFGEFIDRAGAELRLWGWASWKSKVKGLLMWATAYWTSRIAYPDPKNPQNPYEDAMAWVTGDSSKAGERKPWGNGDGRFIYPPMKCVETAGDDNAAYIADEPVPTLRLAMIRDGIEDYEYLTILRSLDPESPLLEVPKQIQESDSNYNVDPSAMEERRIEIARAIVKLIQRKR